MRRAWLVLLLVGCSSTPKTPALDAARAAHRASDDATAYPEFQKALCHEDQSLATARSLVESWVALGKPGTIEQHMRDCKKLPKSVAAYITGLEAAAQGTPEPALLALAEALVAATTDPDRAEILYRQGLVRLDTGDNYGAVENFRDASGDDTQRVDIRLGWAQAQGQARLYSECVNTLRGVLAIDITPNDLDKARRVLRGAVRGAEDPLPAEARAELQDLLSVAERGAVDEHHILHAREILAQFHHASVLTVLGVLSMRAGDVANGANYLNEATALAPLDPDPPRALGFAFFASDRSSLALGPLREAARRDPFDTRVRATLAETASKLGETAIALEAYKALTVLSANQSDNYLWVARLERKQGRVEAARTAALKGLTVRADDIPLLVEHAAIEAQIALTSTEPHVRHQAAGRTRDAVHQLLVVAPGHPGADAIKKSVEGI